MAKYNHGFGVCFNDNDGGASVFCTSEGIEDYKRYASIMGRIRAKLFFMRLMWVSLDRVETYAKVKTWPWAKPLKGWKA